jgi:carbon monoxide dehydrogenase subunit G
LKISGSHTIPVVVPRAYEILRDPGVLARCIPGCEGLTKIGEDEYEMRMKMAISAVQGMFAGKVQIADQKPVDSFRLIVEGSGKIGFMKGEGVLTLAPNGSGTEVRYEGEANIGGMIAGVGQRLLDSTAKFLIKKFFEKLSEEAGEDAAGQSAQ